MTGRIDHIGVVVDDLDEAIRFAGEVLGFPIDRELDLPERRVKAAFVSAGDVSIELIQLSDPELRDARLGSGVQARIEHIAIEVDDLAAAIASLRAHGVRTTNERSIMTAGVESFWTVPGSSDGVIYQILSRVG